ncbi:MAG: response regulator transcription factor [Candidatus Omnitrophica bacterium]|nr:response regulator transcription factor [Candidatus Omnitrophota bacterium]
MKEKILIVEDAKPIARMLEYNLEKEGFRTLVCFDGETALETARAELPGMVILDIMLPGMDGFTVCARLRKESATAQIPIIMLTARAEESDTIAGLESGADDYVAKPFSPRELIARIRAVLRRVRANKPMPPIFRVGELSVDFSKILVMVNNRNVELTAKEFELLKALLQARGKVVSRAYLLDAIWGFEHPEEIETRTVDVHIRTLRKKLKQEANRIVTVKKYGYRFVCR